MIISNKYSIFKCGFAFLKNGHSVAGAVSKESAHDPHIVSFPMKYSHDMDQRIFFVHSIEGQKIPRLAAGETGKERGNYISKGSMLRTGWPFSARKFISSSGSSVQTVSSAIISVKLSTPYISLAVASRRSRT